MRAGRVVQKAHATKIMLGGAVKRSARLRLGMGQAGNQYRHK